MYVFTFHSRFLSISLSDAPIIDLLHNVMTFRVLILRHIEVLVRDSTHNTTKLAKPEEMCTRLKCRHEMCYKNKKYWLIDWLRLGEPLRAIYYLSPLYYLSRLRWIAINMCLWMTVIFIGLFKHLWSHLLSDDLC